MVFTEEEENLIKLGIELYKKRLLLNSKRTEKSNYNNNDISLLQSEIKTAEDLINTEINKLS